MQLAARTEIMALQASMFELPLSRRVYCHVEHIFKPGMYMRRMWIPANTFIVGGIHKHAHENVISEGIVEVLTEGVLTRYEAPHAFISTPGTKRGVHAITDTVWTTYHPNPTNTQDLALVEAEVIAKDYTALEQHQQGRLT